MRQSDLSLFSKDPAARTVDRIQRRALDALDDDLEQTELP